MQVPRGTAPVTARSPVGPLALAGVVVVLDQLTKIWAVAALSDGPVEVIGTLLQFRLTRNPGGAFSLLTGLTPVLAVLAGAMVVYIVRTTRRTTDVVMAYSLGLVLGGAVGNLVDRLVRSPLALGRRGRRARRRRYLPRWFLPGRRQGPRSLGRR